ncbi:AAA family ATPase [Algibacter pectinivorans]|uniref:DNA sulfur modification protein DndD n=1 Tax=Algibacter pectinivorans TaxID=870482 RepID=A0A1I1R7Z3_9FLAO|nr:AAA family ATPase [Algibacter pectinivorans]SFD28268.1 DNA sulfur modification protein DndD [Algibacter pectinivorans]
MLIKRIRAKNFKTYLELDINLETDPDKPIVLIGGANGGGKTTFFDAIYGALYGLNISNDKEFNELLNAGALGKIEEKIELELFFSGRVLNQEQSYVLTRTYMLNTAKKPVESVKLNMNGSIFQYGTATPTGQRAEQEAQVNKIIKGNLPEELSRYFLFDAMEAGSLLKEDRLNRVIRENIENVMGFNRYLSFAKAAECLTQDYTAQMLDLENEKKEYLQLVEQKRKEEETLTELKGKRKEALDFSVSNKDLYDTLKAGMNEESTLNNKVKQLEEELNNLDKEEKQYKTDVNDFIKNFEMHVSLPKLAEVLQNDIALIINERETSNADAYSHLNKEVVENVLIKAVNVLADKGHNLKDVSVSQLADKVLKSLEDKNTDLEYDYFQISEVEALKKLANGNYQNPYNSITHRKENLDKDIANAHKIKKQIEDLKAQITGKDYSLIKAYEENESAIKTLKSEIEDKDKEVKKIAKRLQQFDIPTTEEPDPKFEALKKLQPLFDEIANTLLKNKKDKIEYKMKHDLNVNLAAYQDVIDRVELSEDLKDLNFSIYHKAGNEIYLSQLNTASTQVVVQVLLKALHEFGDYDPPVMIDTVMGVLDETSRSTLLENYFPELSHQTILLSSDSEVRPNSDLQKIEPFVAKAYTLLRDKEAQKTNVTEGYFGNSINN